MKLKDDLETLRAKEPWTRDGPIKWLPDPLLAGLAPRAMSEHHVGLDVRELRPLKMGPPHACEAGQQDQLNLLHAI